ncbi:NAD(P)-dependent alcohol dehydrogenase [Candidatus Dojkabacteria bacterium]|uniref:NAD(P)-dependent alcohol dehydrogenase n=1 Tax=Candidatus Dojkabacteria bacterium TaxID=2099670 RepID=A0A955L371_9BACT|nr:NAD(P)-dependent alcohol dehydrogenase [Candidatus Dojkabacteria bacterium]
MKAAIWTKYGPAEGIELHDIEKPLPKQNEILVKVVASTVSTGDIEMRTMKVPLGLGLFMRLFTGILKPKRIKTLGQEFSGIVEKVGENVKKFKIGDEVFGTTGPMMGANAEYITLPEASNDALVGIKPTNLSYIEAAALPLGSLEAYYFLMKAEIAKGQSIVINGAGGTIGTFAVQLAKHYDVEVTAVDSFEKLEMLASIGADHLIDYKKENFTNNGKKYDVIFDVPGKTDFSKSVKSLKQNGHYLIANPKFRYLLKGIWTSWTTDKNVFFWSVDRNPDDLLLMKKLAEQEKVRPVIDKVYPLEKIVEAHKYVESGVKRGNVVIN